MQAGVGTNRYAYSSGDPINALDPGGNAAVFSDIDGDGNNEYVGQINPGDMGYGEVTCGCPSGSGLQPVHWVALDRQDPQQTRNTELNSQRELVLSTQSWNPWRAIQRVAISRLTQYVARNVARSIAQKASPTNRAIRDLLADPVSLARMKTEDAVEKVVRTFEDAGYQVNWHQSTRKGTSQRKRVINVKGHNRISSISIHPGGGIHYAGYIQYGTNKGITRFVKNGYKRIDEKFRIQELGIE